MPDIHVAWWNVENLFDHERARRPRALASALKNELKGWTKAIRDRKLDQLAAIISLMFEGRGPDLLGVAEVENEAVMKFLARQLTIQGRRYRVLTHPSKDARGIDVSFLFDANTLTPSNAQHQVVVKRTATRDLFWATFTVRATPSRRGRRSQFVAMANHWPARTAGLYTSEPFRLLTGETASYVLADLLEKDKNFPILLMGDFNDEPFNRSMREYLLGTRDRSRLSRARAPRVLNLMWPLMAGRPAGTYRYGSEWNMLDQFLVTKGFLRPNSRVRLVANTVGIFHPSPLQGKGGAPRRFGRPSKKLDRNGYSDHFPITVTVRAK